MAGGFDAVGVDEDGDAWEVAGEHEGLVAGLSGIEENRFSVGDNAWRRRGAAGEKFIREAGKKGFGYGFVTTTKDGDAATCIDKGAGKFFNDGGFASSPDRKISHADDHNSNGVAAKDGVLVESGANAHDACVYGREEEKERLKERGSTAGGTIQDDIGRKLFEGFESL